MEGFFLAGGMGVVCRYCLQQVYGLLIADTVVDVLSDEAWSALEGRSGVQEEGDFVGGGGVRLGSFVMDHEICHKF